MAAHQPIIPHVPTDPLPSLITDKSGPLRQRSLFEWSIPGNPNVGDSAASAGSSVHPVTSGDSTGSQNVRKTSDQHIIPDEDPHRAILLDRDDEEGDPFDLMGDGVGDEFDGGEDEDEDEENGDPAEAASKPRGRRSLPPAVKDQYDKHLDFLKQGSGLGSMPKLYAVHQTFWLPHQANFFIMKNATKPRPSQLYNHRWFYWDPDHLVEGGLKCPNCGTHLHRHGFTRPRRVVDLEAVFYMIGQ
jgi:hypothetical protein